jgi:hypothetical protein
MFQSQVKHFKKRNPVKQLCIGLVMALAFSTIASAASRNHLTRHHYGHSYRAGAATAGTASAARFQSHFDNN